MTTEERLEKLERELACAKRNHRRVLVCAGVFLGMIFAWVFFAQSSRLGTAQAEGPTTVRGLVDLGPALTTAPGQREVRARSFVLEDDKGRTRAELAMDWGRDAPVLILYDDKGKPRAELSARKAMPYLVMRDENGTGRASLGVAKEGPMLHLCDEDGKPRAKLIVFESPILALEGENDHSMAMLSAGNTGPMLALGDENGKLRVGLVVAKAGPGLVLSDENGQCRAALGAERTETAAGKPISYPESSLRLFGPDGKLRWSAP